jgi:hypothetical protein
MEQVHLKVIQKSILYRKVYGQFLFHFCLQRNHSSVNLIFVLIEAVTFQQSASIRRSARTIQLIAIRRKTVFLSFNE